MDIRNIISSLIKVDLKLFQRDISGLDILLGKGTSKKIMKGQVFGLVGEMLASHTGVLWVQVPVLAPPVS